MKEIPLRALNSGKMPLNIFLQASKQLFWLKVHCTPFSLVPNVVNSVKNHCKFDPWMSKKIINKFPTLFGG